MLVNRYVRTPDGNVLSMRLEQKFWNAFLEICRRERCRPGILVRRIEETRAVLQDGITRSAAIRIYVLGYFLDAATEEGHQNAGHGRQPPAQHEAPLPDEAVPQKDMAA